MRNGLLAVFLSIGATGATACAPDSSNDADDSERVGNPKYVDERFFHTLDTMLPELKNNNSPDHFVVTAATWNTRDRILDANIRTRDEKGTLLTMTGLPESTMVDSFKISSNYSVNHQLRLAKQQAIPCRLIISAGSQIEIVDVDNAPAACNNQFQIGGKLLNQSLDASRVKVIVGGLAFETQVEDDGSFALDVYNETADSRVLIFSSSGETDVPVYSGTLVDLLEAESLSASTSAWAKEILGRRHTRKMLAAN